MQKSENRKIPNRKIEKSKNQKNKESKVENKENTVFEARHLRNKNR